MTYSLEPGLQPALSLCVVGSINIPLCLSGLTALAFLLGLKLKTKDVLSK